MEKDKFSLLIYKELMIVHLSQSIRLMAWAWSTLMAPLMLQVCQVCSNPNKLQIMTSLLRLASKVITWRLFTLRGWFLSLKELPLNNLMKQKKSKLWILMLLLSRLMLIKSLKFQLKVLRVRLLHPRKHQNLVRKIPDHL